jgi:hypothetical protein
MRWSLLLVLASLLSGCAAPPPAVPAVPAEPVRLAVQGVLPVDRVQWANGTFAATETCDTGQCLVAGFVGGSHTRNTDVAGGAQEGVPLRVRAWLATRASAGALQLRLFTQAPVLSLAIHPASEAGAPMLDALVVPDGTPIVVRVFALRPDPAGLDYTLRIRTESHPDALVPGVPYGLAVPANSTLTLTSEAPLPTLLLWDAGDRYLGPMAPGPDGKVALAAGGEYVLVVAGQGEAVHATASANGTLRILETTLREGPARSESGRADDTWTFQLPEGGAFPLSVGLRVAGGAQVEPGGNITGPLGPVVEGTPDHQGFPVDASVGGADHAWMSRIGDLNLVPGTYMAHVALVAPLEAEARVVQLAYVR